MGAIIFFGVILSLPIAAISYKISLIYRANKNNKPFNYNSETRIIKRNNGYGEYLYPQFHNGVDWVDFKDSDFCSYSHWMLSDCETFIKNKKAAIKPDIVIVKTNEEFEKLYLLEDYEK